jgi:hypothetical protein
VGGDKLQYEILGGIVHLYALEPREALQRGRGDEAHKRLERLRDALNSVANFPLPQDEYRKKVAEWRDRVRNKVLGNQQVDTRDLLGEDQYLMSLLNPNQEVATRDLPRTVLSYLVFRVEGAPLHNEMVRLEALRWHEQAARTPAGPEAKEAWDNARDLWGQYTARVPLTLAGRMQPLQDALRLRRADLAHALAAHLQVELRQSASAAVQQAACLEQLDRKQEAAAALGRLADQLAALQKSPELDELFQSVPAEKRAQARREAFPDLEPNGTFHWLISGARLRQRLLTAKGDDGSKKE